MALIVQKFGGTSVADAQCIQRVAQIVAKQVKQGDQVAVVLSAMADTTDKLLKLAGQISNQPNQRELDALLATGEQVSVSLLSMALTALGVKACSMTGAQAGILTDSDFNQARIVKIDSSAIKACLKAEVVPVITGFQGVDSAGNITTLGRGGSDTSAVAIAVELGAEECQIFTDVAGVYNCDPRFVPTAKKIQRINFEEMLEMSSMGSKVIQKRAVEFAGKFNMPLRVLSTFEPGPGTLVTYQDRFMEKALVSGIAFEKNQVKITLLGLPNKPGVAEQVLNGLSQANLEIDMMVQATASNQAKTNFIFTIKNNKLEEILDKLNYIAKMINAEGFDSQQQVAKLSVVGVGMRSHAAIAKQMFGALAKEGINIQLISASEIRISVVIAEAELKQGISALFQAFDLSGAELHH